MNMKTIEQQLYNYIDGHEDSQYMTGRDIVISAPDVDWLKAEFIWVNTIDTTLSVSLYSTATDFVKLLGIKNISDIDNLVAGRILELYYDGLAEMVCFITLEYIYGMSFKKLGHTIIAENESGYKHTIPAFKKIETPDQYILYTTAYYKLMECNEN